MQISASWIARSRCSMAFARWPSKSWSADSRWCLAARIDSKASSMCGCRSGMAAAAGAGAGAATAAGVGATGAFGPAAAAGNATEISNVAESNSVKKTIFFIFVSSSSSEFRRGRRRQNQWLRVPRSGLPRHPHSIAAPSRISVVHKLALKVPEVHGSALIFVFRRVPS